jgi:glutamate--cysteine ligase
MIVWQNVDIERCRVPKFVFFDNFSYSKYINNILNVPIIFLFKKNEYIKIPKMTFLDYIKNGFNQNFATEMDFLNHLNGIFWIVRSKPQIEIRNTNINNLNFNCGIVAFIQGIIYNDKCFDKVYFLLREIGPMEISSIIKMISTNNLTEKYRKYLNKTTYDCLIIANNFLKSKKSNHFLKILFNNLEDI